MYNLIKIIQEANPGRSVKNISRRLHKLAEELGEVSEAYLYVTTEDPKKDKTWPDFREEAVDVAIVALDLALTKLPIDEDKTPEEIEQEVIAVFEQKLNKWRQQLEKGQDATQREKDV